MAKEILCPHCEKTFPSPIPDPPTLDQIQELLNKQPGQTLTAEQLDDAIKRNLSPKANEHRHKTADELLDCPECSSWFGKTATKYEVKPKVETLAPKQEIGSLRG
ncbi:unnamed protein product [marine sediment metagenome]|uniref:Uncharacterized protein n=1 Tax=marine sediment metagenome TaxID=412755 RepID=X1QHY2_9ZZZZ